MLPDPHGNWNVQRPPRQFKGSKGGGRRRGKDQDHDGSFQDDHGAYEHRGKGGGGGYRVDQAWDGNYHDQWEEARRPQRWPSNPSNEGFVQGMQTQGSQYAGMAQPALPPPPPPVVGPPGWRADGRSQASQCNAAAFGNGRGLFPGKGGQMRSDAGAGGNRHQINHPSGPSNQQRLHLPQQYRQQQPMQVLGRQNTEDDSQPQPLSNSDVSQLLIHMRDRCSVGDANAAIDVLLHVLQDGHFSTHQQMLPHFLEEMNTCLFNVVANEKEQEQTNNTVHCHKLSDIAFRLGKTQVQGPTVHDILASVAFLARNRADQFTPAILSSMVWGFACLSVQDGGLMSLAAAEIVNKINGFDHRQLSSTAWAFAKCGLWNNELASCIAAECKEQIVHFSPASLSNIAWAMAQWGVKEQDLMEAIAQEAINKRDVFDPASLAMTAWAYAMLQVRLDPVMQFISEESIKRMSFFKKQDLAHLAWAFASLKVQDSVALELLTEEVKKNMKGTQPPELANMAWAFSKMSTANDEIMQMLADEAAPLIGRFKTTEITMVTWAYGVSGRSHCALMSEIGDKVSQRLEKFSAAQIAHVAWGFGALNMRHNLLLQKISEYAKRDMKAMGAQGLTSIAFTFAKVWYRDDDFMTAAASVITEELHQLKPMALSRAAWAYSVLQASPGGVIEAVLAFCLMNTKGMPMKVISNLAEFCMSGISSAHSEEVRVLLFKVYKQAGENLASLFPNFTSLSAGASEEAIEKVKTSGLSDFRLMGTPLVLQKLGFHMPSYDFIARSFKKAKDKTCQYFVTMELQVKIVKEDDEEDSIDELYVRYFTDFHEAPGNDEQQAVFEHFTPGLLVAGDETEAVCHLLTLCTACIAKTGINLDVEAETEAVHGVLRVLVTEVPSLASLVVLLQMKARFPKLKIEAVEMQASSPSCL